MTTTNEQFSAASERGKDKYQPFPGKVIEQMPILLADGREPVSTAHTADRRLYADEEVRPKWRNNYVFTGDAPVYNGEGEVKLVLDSQDLREVNPQSSLYPNTGALVLSPSRWKALRGKKVMPLSQKDLQELNGKGYTRQTAKQSDVWRFILRSKKRQNDYADLVADATQSDDIMRVYFDLEQYNLPVLRPLVLLGFGDRSFAVGNDILNVGSGRLVGVVSGGAAHVDGREAQSKKNFGVPTRDIAVGVLDYLRERTFDQGIPSQKELERVIRETV